MGSIKLLNTLNGVLCIRCNVALTNHIVADVEFRCKLYLL